MHTLISNNTLSMNSGLTLGGNTSLLNWEPIARAHQQLAQHYWLHQPSMVMEKAQPFLPHFKFAPPATADKRKAFAVAIRDSVNTLVINKNGNRQPPTYDHNVDDNVYGDITELMPHAASTRVALYEILGYPDSRIPDSISWDKFKSVHSHIFQVVGREFNTRDLTFALPHDNRQALLSTLEDWCTKNRAPFSKLRNYMSRSLMPHEQTGKDLQCSLASKMRCAEPSNYNTTKSMVTSLGSRNATILQRSYHSTCISDWTP